MEKMVTYGTLQISLKNYSGIIYVIPKKTAYMSNFAQNKSKMFIIIRFKNDFIQLIK